MSKEILSWLIKKEFSLLLLDHLACAYSATNTYHFSNLILGSVYSCADFYRDCNSCIRSCAQIHSVKRQTTIPCKQYGAACHGCVTLACDRDGKWARRRLGCFDSRRPVATVQ